MAWLQLLILLCAVTASPQDRSSAGGDAKGSQSSSAVRADKKPEQDARADEKSSEESKKTAEPASKTSVKKPTMPAKAAAPKATSGPRVLTRSEMRKRSAFLEPPGVQGAAIDRYGTGTPDWSEIPPWRQTSFFGIRAPGRFFVYVIDCSESMIEEDRFARATMEVRRSVMALQAPQQFEVIFYNDGSIPMPGGPKPRPADMQNKAQLRSWLRLVEPDGGTDPRTAIRQALMLRPEAVFLLSDGEFPDGTAQAVAHFNARRIPIHCVDLSAGEGGDHLRRIARESGGQYAMRPGNLQGKR